MGDELNWLVTVLYDGQLLKCALPPGCHSSGKAAGRHGYGRAIRRTTCWKVANTTSFQRRPPGESFPSFLAPRLHR